MQENSLDGMRRRAFKLFQAGEYRQTLEVFDRILAHGVCGADLLNLAGMAHYRLGRNKQAIQLVSQAQQQDPDNPIILNNLGNIYWSGGYLNEAAGLIEQARERQPDDPMIVFNLGQIYADMDRHDEAVATLGMARKLAPDNHHIANRLGMVHAQYGERDLAEDYFRQAMEIEPRFVRAYFNLVKTTKADHTDQKLRKNILHLTMVDGLPEDKKSLLFFALAEMHRNGRDYDNAFRWYERANGAVDVRFDQTAYSESIDDIRDAWSGERLASLAEMRGETVEPAGPRMIFIVGMPRSGTSLTEQILSAHPEVEGVGELTAIRDVERAARAGRTIGEFVAGLDRDQIRQCRAQFFQRLPDRAKKATFVTEKLPMNLMHVGLISVLFPDAAIIHCRRHPLDVTLSCFFQNFHRGNTFAFDLDNIAHVYIEMERLMAHWKTVLGERIVTLQYEELVADTETQTRRLLKHAGLSWDPAVLQPEQNRRSVKTASKWQVHDKIHSTSIGRWRHYSKHLEPAMARFRQAGFELD